MSECVERVLHTEARVPTSTYRLQMHGGFPFSAAQAILPYLRTLGIGDIYLSPIFEARPGSQHGYDVTRHDRLNPELDGMHGFDSFSEELKRLNFGVLLDMVPNHMGVGNDSVWWQDVLENGHASSYSEYFDIDWHPLKKELEQKLLLPILADQYGAELEAKRIQVAIEKGRPVIKYYDHIMPVAPRTWGLLFPREEGLRPDVPADFREQLDQLTDVPPHETDDAALQKHRRKSLAQLLPRLREELRAEAMQPALAAALEGINGVEGTPASFDRLHELLEAQPYRLASWRTSAEQINYRRFFDINDLVGLRMENPAVFAATHGLVRSLIATGKVTGLRIDHCDGMFNPRQYLIRLQLLYLASQCSGETPQGDAAANGIERGILNQVRGYDWSKSQGALYTVVEKILEPREYIPPAWPVHGTSGYDFIYLANNIFIQPANQKHFDALYARILGYPSDPDAIIYRSKLQVMQSALASEVYVLTSLLSRIAAANRRVRDFTDSILETVLRQTIASFPVYRTYIDDRGQYSDRDVAFIRYAIARAKRLNPDIDASAFDFLRDTLLLRSASGGRNPDPQALYFALKFQQLTGPVMAKGVEDTTFYVYSRFISCNEVGGSVKSFGISVESLHQSNGERVRFLPGSMTTTSTHDTKRSEDVRNRLNVLSELPHDWTAAVRRWQRMNVGFKPMLEDGRIAPDSNEEYLLYQTIVGAWPWQMRNRSDREKFLERIKQYAAKALSEAKVNLSWLNPDPVYMQAVHSFLQSILLPVKGGGETPFVRSLLQWMPRLSLFGAVNSLSQLVLKIASPGVPDFYQGCELWDLSLVDPDNRRPVDYDLRSRALSELIERAGTEGNAAVCREVLRKLADGRAKLWTTYCGLQLRTREPSVFLRGDYLGLEVANINPEHVVAFLRRDPASGRSVLAAIPRFACTLMQRRTRLPMGSAWGRSKLLLPPGASSRYIDVFTGEKLHAEPDGSLRLADVFASYPVALMAGED